jgi:diacylglycerol kinase (ATP)
MAQSPQKVYVVFNPKAGNAGTADQIRSELARRFTPPEWSLEIYETTGQEDLPSLGRAACNRGVSMVVSAGGDGTVVGVANSLVNCPVPLGILPMGTGNDLARALNIPLKIDEALDLLVGDHGIIEVDALKVRDRYFFSNASVGVSPEMMQETKSDQKQRFGFLAYVWTLVKRSSLFQLHRYTVTIDGQRRRIRAAEILISTTTLLEKPPYVFGPPETLNDGQLEVYLITARTLIDYLQLVWNVFRHPGQPSTKLRHWIARQSIRIEADRSPQLVQGDGEVIGHTPLEIALAPRVLRVVVPKALLTSDGLATATSVAQPQAEALAGGAGPGATRPPGSARS